MPGRNASLDALQVRKNLLLLEAEVHRAQLRQDWAEIKNGLRYGREKARSASLFLTVANLGMAALSGFRRNSRSHGSAFSHLLTRGAIIAGLLRFASRLFMH